MADLVTNGYCTLEELKEGLDIEISKQDSILSRAINAASRQIDNYCQRVFYQTEEQVRYFSTEYYDLLTIDDLTSITELATDVNGLRTYDTIWLPTDYELGPRNAGATGFPYTILTRTPLGLQSFPRIADSIRITGTWGWPEVPDDIRQVCLILAYRLYKRKDAPFGVMGSTELGQYQAINKIDPDAVQILDRYRRFAIGGI